MSHRSKTFRGVRNFYTGCNCYLCTGDKKKEQKLKRIKLNKKEVRNLMVKYKQSA